MNKLGATNHKYPVLTIMASVMFQSVLYNFYPDFDQSMEIDHKDENRANNSILNLEALTKEAPEEDT
jgi:hypothetical protein